MKRKNTVPYILSMMMAALILCLPVRSYAEDALAPSSFMDMKSSFDLVMSNVSKVRKSIVIVVAYDSSGVAKTGSGMFIDTEGRIIVNANVMENAYSAEVFSESKHYEKVVMLGRNKSIDLALLQVDAVNEKPVEVDYEYEVKPGERVIVVGRSDDYKTTVSEGLVSSLKNIGEALDFIEIETTAGLLSYQFSKDGFVMRMDGKVVGIAVKGMARYKDEPFPLEYYGAKLDAVTISSIKPLVSGPYKIERFQPSGTKIWSHWLKRQLDERVTAVFITSYNLGFKKILNRVLVFIVLIGLIIYVFGRLREKWLRK